LVDNLFRFLLKNRTFYLKITGIKARLQFENIDSRRAKYSHDYTEIYRYFFNFIKLIYYDFIVKFTLIFKVA